MYKVKDKDELRKIILENSIELDTLDVSNITDMNNLFKKIEKINGSISDWNANERIINNLLLIVNEDKR